VFNGQRPLISAHLPLFSRAGAGDVLFMPRHKSDKEPTKDKKIYYAPTHKSRTFDADDVSSLREIKTANLHPSSKSLQQQMGQIRRNPKNKNYCQSRAITSVPEHTCGLSSARVRQPLSSIEVESHWKQDALLSQSELARQRVKRRPVGESIKSTSALPALHLQF
ncbi:hypothetical protein QQF64_017539, partial [Cirrhinus molitorella]